MADGSHIPQKNTFPRLLIGATLIFWGWMAELPIVGLTLAFLFEGPHWLTIRWNFGEKAYVRSWSLSVVAMIFSAFFLIIDGVRPETVRVFVSWMPIMLFPVQFTQAYGFQQQIPLNTFSYFSRKKLAIDRSLGMRVEPLMISFTPVYFVICLLFCAAGKNAYHPMFFPIMLALAVWFLWASGRKSRRRNSAFIVALLLMMVVAFIGQWGLIKAQDFLTGGMSGNALEQGDSSQWQRSNTQIGQVGKIKQSSRIHWRLETQQGTAPDLLRTASYNRYFPSGHWRYETPLNDTQENDFKGLSIPGLANRKEKPNDEIARYYTTSEQVKVGMESRADLPRFLLRGSVQPDSLLPLPGSMHTIYLAAQDMEFNSIGSIRITPLHAVMESAVRWNADFDSDGSPFSPDGNRPSSDEMVPEQERQVMEEIVASLALRTMSLEDKIATLRLYFMKNFTYTTYLTISSQLSRKRMKEESENSYRTMTGRDSALAQFLLEEKRGHCEYFATATTLLLRAAGEKARYCVGYSVQEKDKKTGQYVLRGTHAHAWSRVWNARTGRWLDVDTTPSSWVAMDAASSSKMQDLIDYFQRLREDFTVWRIQPANQTKVGYAMAAIGAILALLIGRVLWKTRTKVARQKRDNPTTIVIKTPLSDMEKWLGGKIGQRSPGTTYAHWLAALSERINPELVSRAVAIHNRLRFDPQAAEPALYQQLLDICRQIKSSLR
jgi:protein-glutamine gamma-glutamyltransferase